MIDVLGVFKSPECQKDAEVKTLIGSVAFNAPSSIIFRYFPTLRDIAQSTATIDKDDVPNKSFLVPGYIGPFIFRLV